MMAVQQWRSVVFAFSFHDFTLSYCCFCFLHVMWCDEDDLSIVTVLVVVYGCQSTCHTVILSQPIIVWQVDRLFSVTLYILLSLVWGNYAHCQCWAQFLGTTSWPYSVMAVCSCVGHVVWMDFKLLKKLIQCGYSICTRRSETSVAERHKNNAIAWWYEADVTEGLTADVVSVDDGVDSVCCCWSSLMPMSTLIFS